MCEKNKIFFPFFLNTPREKRAKRKEDKKKTHEKTDKR